jgi:class 3 adenylate cyclase/tetratricopeptide (TPR) repeat protein
MRDIATWLQSLGLGKYAAAFERNEIDFDTLPLLTQSMLEEIGLPIGPRAKLLAAIAKLASSPPTALAGDPIDQPTVETAGGRPEAERRQITVMFCDLVESTRLATSLDPEDLGSLMAAYQRACRAIIERYGGYVARYLGDGVLAYFGWPTAHEDAAERAVRAGIEVVEAVKAVPATEPLSVRIGISTGIVVISSAGFVDPSSPSEAVGEALHVAARIQTLATPDAVVIAEATGRLVSPRFDLDDLGPHSLKGIEQPVLLFRVRRVREHSSRFEAAQRKILTPLVGRRAELAFLRERWRSATAGEGQAVFVSGVPGVGKSRIVHELEEGIRSEQHISLHFQCLPHGVQSALFPVIQQIQRYARFKIEDSDNIKLYKIERMVRLVAPHIDRAVPYIAEMLSVPSQPRYGALDLSAQQVKAQTFSVLIDLLIALSNKRPVLCLIEDAQWIDPSTQELLDLLIGQISKARVLLVVTHRPEYSARGGTNGNTSGLVIPRLGRRDATEMAQLALRGRTVSTAAVERLIDESDLIPLFVEELASGVFERQHVDWFVPDSLRDSLVARLDRVPQARTVAQTAAAIGREFSHHMLLRVSSLSDSELDSALAHLRHSEIIQLIDNRPPARYMFKHALVRDAAYETLLRSSRRAIHERLASIIEKEWPEIVAAQPELLAHHYGLAGDAERAVQYWLQGGARARTRSSNFEAAGQYEKALESLELLPETLQRRETELETQLSLGLCRIAVRGYSARETRRAFERASRLSAELEQSEKEIQAIFGLWGHYWMRARHDRALELAQTLLAKAERIGDATAVIVGHRSLGSTLFTLGEFVRAREHLARAVDLGQNVDIAGSSLSYAVDPRVAARLILSWDLWILGFPEQARDIVGRALKQAIERDDPYSVAFAHYVTSAVLLLRGEADEALSHADRSLAVSQEHRINLYALYSRFGRGCALADKGQHEQAIVEIQAGIEEAQQSNLRYMHAFMLGWLAALQIATGHKEAALSTLDEALQRTNDVLGRPWEAELLRLRGDALLLAGPGEATAAESWYRRAMAIAQHQQARSLELRAATSLARLLMDQRRAEEGREVLASVYRWFTEGFDTRDLKTARCLLESMAASR